MNRRAVLWVSLAVALAAGPKAMAGGQNGIPLPAGQFSVTLQGYLASCVNSGGAPEPCNASGAVVVPLSLLEAGTLTRNPAGNACSPHTAVASTFPVGAAPPNVVEENTVITLIDYDPMTGTGDESFTGYLGGACNGATLIAPVRPKLSLAPSTSS